MIIARNRAAFQQTVMCQTCERPKVSTYRKCLDLRGERLLLFPRSNQTAYSFMNTFWMFTSVWHLKTSLATRKLWYLCYIFYSQTQSRFRFLPLPFVFKFRLALQNRVERRGGCYILLWNGTTLQDPPPIRHQLSSMAFMWTDVSDRTFPAVVMSLAILVPSQYIYHLSDGHRKATMLTILSKRTSIFDGCLHPLQNRDTHPSGEKGQEVRARAVLELILEAIVLS